MGPAVKSHLEDKEGTYRWAFEGRGCRGRRGRRRGGRRRLVNSQESREAKGRGVRGLRSIVMNVPCVQMERLRNSLLDLCDPEGATTQILKLHDVALYQVRQLRELRGKSHDYAVARPPDLSLQSRKHTCKSECSIWL